MSEARAAHRPALPDTPDLVNWYSRTVYPLWFRFGRDHACGGYFEELDADFKPVPQRRRCRVHARQMYAAWVQGQCVDGFDHSKVLYDDAETLLRTFSSPCGLFHSTTGPDGDSPSETRENYDQAFAIFGLAYAFAATGDTRFQNRAVRCVETLLETRAHPVAGFVDDPLLSDPSLRANPHMHFLEAFLAWADFDPDPIWLEMTESITRLAAEHLVLGSQYLCEEFQPDWTPPRGVRRRYFEPGHHYEWAVLLDRASRAGARTPNDLPSRLVQSAEQFGVDHHRGVIFNRVGFDGRVLDAGSRLWPYTERIKAILCFPDLFTETAVAETFCDLTRTVASLQGFRGDLSDGLWRDRTCEKGRLDRNPSKASSLYHVAGSVHAVVRARSASPQPVRKVVAS